EPVVRDSRRVDVPHEAGGTRNRQYGAARRGGIPRRSGGEAGGEVPHHARIGQYAFRRVAEIAEHVLTVGTVDVGRPSDRGKRQHQGQSQSDPSKRATHTTPPQSCAFRALGGRGAWRVPVPRRTGPGTKAHAATQNGARRFTIRGLAWGR